MLSPLLSWVTMTEFSLEKFTPLGEGFFFQMYMLHPGSSSDCQVLTSRGNQCLSSGRGYPAWSRPRRAQESSRDHEEPATEGGDRAPSGQRPGTCCSFECVASKLHVSKFRICLCGRTVTFWARSRKACFCYWEAGWTLTGLDGVNECPRCKPSTWVP